MSNFAGRNWSYDFREIDTIFTDIACRKIAVRLFDRYSKLTRAWSEDLNSEWTCRLFMAAKLIMSSTLYVNSAHYAEDRNLRVVVPYLRYYSVLSLLRAVCYTLPEQKWADGNLITISQRAAIDCTLGHLQSFDTTVAEGARAVVRELKAERELISYRAPSSGDDQISEKNRFLSLCALLAEVAQFNSELFETSLLKHANPTHFKLLPEYAAKITGVEIGGNYFGDSADAYHLGFLSRPGNLQFLMTERHVDDFFGAWRSKKKGRNFNPDSMHCIIFDIP